MLRLGEILCAPQGRLCIPLSNALSTCNLGMSAPCTKVIAGELRTADCVVLPLSDLVRAAGRRCYRLSCRQRRCADLHCEPTPPPPCEFKLPPSPHAAHVVDRFCTSLLMLVGKLERWAYSPCACLQPKAEEASHELPRLAQLDILDESGDEAAFVGKEHERCMRSVNRRRLIGAALIFSSAFTPVAQAQTPITNTNISTAATAWITSPTTAAMTYGNIADWNMAAVSSMWFFILKVTSNID
jgi:hypothetical protein